METTDNNQTENTSTGEGDKTGQVVPVVEQPVTFTQADIDRIAGKTRKEALATWAKEHGFSGVQDLEEVIKAKKEADEQAKSELQKALEAAQKERQARETLESQLKAERIKAAVVSKATELNFAYPADTLALLNMSAFEIDDTGKVSGYEKALEDLAKSGRLPLKGQQQQIGNQTRRPGATPATNQKQDGQKPIIRF